VKEVKQPLAIAEQCEGKLFLSIALIGNPNFGYHTHGDYYTVSNGVVYFVNDGTFQASGDTLLQLVCDCKCIGVFNPETRYESKRRHLSFAKAKRMLGL
jgi:hypothetical protein